METNEVIMNMLIFVLRDSLLILRQLDNIKLLD